MTEKMFTQEEVNSIIQNRLAQEKAKTDAMLAQKDTEWAEKVKNAESAAILAKVQAANEKRTALIVDALTKKNSVTPSEVAKILDSRVKVKESDGSIYYEGADGKEMTVEEGVNAYLKENPCFVRNTAAGGAGTGPVPFPGMVHHGPAADTALRKAMGLSES